MDSGKTALHLLADELLDGDLAGFVADRRPQSWDSIALDLGQATSGRVAVNGETLRLWFPEHRAKAAS